MQRFMTIALGIMLMICALQFGLLRWRADQAKLQTARVAVLEDAFKASESARRRSERAYYVLTRDRALAASKSASASLALGRAVQDSPDWAKSPVPEGVRGAFR